MEIHIPHTIRVRLPHARQVSLVGDFNHWQPNSDPLVQVAPDVWERVIDLPPGRHRYGFLVLDDPAQANGAIRSRLVAANSVIHVCATLEESFVFPPASTNGRLVA